MLPILLPGNWQTLLEYQRTALAEGDLWRLLTGHLVHLGWGHLGMNLIGFWLIHQLFFRHGVSLSVCLGGLLILMLWISAGLYLFSPALDWYRGFSGVLHGLLIWALLRDLRRHTAGNLLLLMLVIGKLAWEQVGGPLPGSESIAKGRVIVDAHLYGALGGALLWSVEFSRSKIHERGS